MKNTLSASRGGVGRGLQTYFGVSDGRGEEILAQLTACFINNMHDPKMQDVNMLKFVTAQNVKDLLEMTDANELLLVGILIEQAHNATLQKPQKSFWGNLK